jgi:radical SAM superfamily enzyme YgiQ (UPF0313 family)
MQQNYTAKEVHIFNFEDDNLTLHKRWFRHFLQAVISNPMWRDIELTALNGICYPTLDEPILELMYAAGFRQLPLSFVTHDIQLRRALKRPKPAGNLEQIVRKAQELGFFITVYLIIGLPQQTYDEIKTSIDYLLDLGVLIGPSVFYIPPAAALYPKLDLPSAIRSNWNMYRSSAFAVETEFLNRSQLVQLFSYTREQNLKRKNGGKK